MLIRFWGVRGSIPSPINAASIETKIKQILRQATPSDVLSEQSIEQFISTLSFSLRGTYGGNTTCLEMRNENDDIYIIDSGSGITKLGHSLMKEDRMKGQAKLNMFFTHTHWDHIQGFLFFIPLFVPGNQIKIHSAFLDIEDRLRYQQMRTHFPIIFDEFPADISFEHFKEREPIIVNNVELISKAIRHPGGNYTFKFIEEVDGKKKVFIFCSDAEFNFETLENISDYIDFFSDADVLVFDTQYTFVESLQKIDWGHSSASIATDIAIKSNVKKLILFHHDPAYNDDDVDNMMLKAIKYKRLLAPNKTLKIEVAYEGLELKI